uniref:Uncharacterized protein n=1 Tax=Mesocestoides corti TaxID=53468 RepID=A0A5K3FQ02_MESCO
MMSEVRGVWDIAWCCVSFTPFSSSKHIQSTRRRSPMRRNSNRFFGDYETPVIVKLNLCFDQSSIGYQQTIDFEEDELDNLCCGIRHVVSNHARITDLILIR